MAESSDETGGPAFPTGRIPDPNDTNRVLQRSGMTLRDYFAGQAVLGAVNGWSRDAGACAEAARRAYLLADAMLTERAKGR